MVAAEQIRTGRIRLDDFPGEVPGRVRAEAAALGDVRLLEGALQTLLHWKRKGVDQPSFAVTERKTITQNI